MNAISGTSNPPRWGVRLVLLLATAGLAGCVTAPTGTERENRASTTQIGAELRWAQANLPPLRENSTLEEYVRFAVYHHPAVMAAYSDWRAATEETTVARSLPDPQVTFQADVSDTLMTFMPGFMFDLMSPGRRTAMAREATAKSGIAYRAYVAAVLRTALEVRKSWVELAYTLEAARLYVATVGTLELEVDLAKADYATTRGMASLDRMVELQNTLGEHHVHHVALGERTVAAYARLKSAIGLAHDDPMPAWPQPVLTATGVPSADELWKMAQTSNPDLASMRAMVAMAVAEVDSAEVARQPAFSVGLMADLKAIPLMLRPVAAASLPVWRARIAARLTAAEARRDAATARVKSEELTLSAELAQTLFSIREADRMIAYVDSIALPNFEILGASAAANYQSGSASPGAVLEARRMALLMRIERLKSLQERELAAADLSLEVAGMPPGDAPVAEAEVHNH